MYFQILRSGTSRCKRANEPCRKPVWSCRCQIFLCQQRKFHPDLPPRHNFSTAHRRLPSHRSDIYELHINEQEAAVVRIVFDKYVYEGYGPQHIATYLNNSGYRARSGKCWHPSSIRGMVQNLTYTGVLRCGDARSELVPDLQIVPQEQFENAQRIRNTRSTSRSTSTLLRTSRESDTFACKTVGHRTSIFKNNQTARIGGCRPCACKIRHLADSRCNL